MKSRLSFSEIIVLEMACLAPWAFGSVDAWAEFALALGIALLGTLAIFSRPRINPMRRLNCWPSLVLGGLAVLAVTQATALPAGFLGWLDPVTAALRGDLLPAQPEVVLGDPAAPVAFPPRILSLEPGVTVQAAVKLAAAWVLFQGVLGLTSGFAGLRRLGLVLAWNATLMALVGLVQALTWNGSLLWIRPLPNGSIGISNTRRTAIEPTIAHRGQAPHHGRASSRDCSSPIAFMTRSLNRLEAVIRRGGCNAWKVSRWPEE